VHGSIRGPDVYVTDIANLFIPTAVQQFHTSDMAKYANLYTGNVSEWTSYMGILLPLLCLVIARYRRVREVGFLGLLWVVLLILSLGPHLHIAGRIFDYWMPWQLFQVGIFGNILPSRLMVHVYLLSGVLLAFFVDRSVRGPSPRRLVRLAPAVLAIALLMPTFPFFNTPATVPDFFKGPIQTAVPRGGIVLVAPYTKDGDFDQPMLWQSAADFRFKMPDGYFLQDGPDGIAITGPLPSALGDALDSMQRTGIAPPATDAIRAQMRAELHAASVSSVIVGPTPRRAEIIDFFARLLGAPPVEVGGVALWRSVP
jgi:hypothetical protein